MRLIRSLIVATAVVGPLVLAEPAFAARPVQPGSAAAGNLGPYSISAGTKTTGTTTFTATSGPVQFDTSTGLSLTCDHATADGEFNLGTSTDGVGVASFTSSSFVNCVGPLGIPIDVTQASPWRANFTGPASTVTAGDVDQISAHVSNPDGQCDFDVTGSVDGNFNSSNQTGSATQPTQGAQLDISNVSGCFGLIEDGTTATYQASYGFSAADGPITVG